LRYFNIISGIKSKRIFISKNDVEKIRLAHDPALLPSSNNEGPLHEEASLFIETQQ
jgi:hypothetical protein